jgi:Domain of unknown function (DUF4419)
LLQDSGKIETPARFEVSDVEKATDSLPELPYDMAVESFVTNKPIPKAYWKQTDKSKPLITKNRMSEACAGSNERLVAGVQFHPVIAAIDRAFNDHRPLYLSPDIIWLLISQGLAEHINKNSEKLRHHFVQHPGKVTINIQRDDFVKGDLENPWTEVFSEISGMIRSHIGVETYHLILPTFSTTGTVERAAAEIVLFDAMKSYFRYSIATCCGIPQIELAGTVADWQQLLDRTKQLAQFELDWWIRELIPILEQFIAAASGKIDRSFWQSMYKWNSKSGGSYITGWIVMFFPYIIKKYLARKPTNIASKSS